MTSDPHFRKLVCTLFACLGLTLVGCQSKPSSSKAPAPPPPSEGGKKGKKPTNGETEDANIPVKGCCGSMSFHSKQKWQPAPSGSGQAFCTNIPKGDRYAVAINDASAPFAQLTGNWTVTVNSYVPGSNPGRMSREGVVLSAFQKSCDGQDLSSMSLTMRALRSQPALSGSADFYPNEGPQSAGWGSNRRFRDNARYADYDCNTDRDLCERIGFVTANGITKACNEADCIVYLKRQ